MWTIHISIFAVELEWQTVFRTLLEFSMNFYGFTYILPYHRQQFMRQHSNPSILIRSLRIRQGVNITRFIGSVYQTEPPECETNSIHTEPWPLRVVLIFALFCWISNEIPFSYHLAMNSCCMLRSWFAIEIFWMFLVFGSVDLELMLWMPQWLHICVTLSWHCST